MGFMNSLKNTLNTQFNSSRTENGSLGYRTTGKNLLDLNFAVSSLRNADEAAIAHSFAKAFYEDRLLAVKWLFYASDVREGLGERRLFRICFRYLAENQPQTAGAVMALIPEYSRWDNLLCLFATPLEEKAAALIERQLDTDMTNRGENKPISLCAKWLPSANASSETTRRLARELIKRLGITERQYRKMLSCLRSYLNVTEVSMSSRRWERINYESVPARANLIYNKAFLRNDEVRRRAYLEQLKKGEVKIQAGVLYPHDIVHRYFDLGGQVWNPVFKPLDDTLEALWSALPDYVSGAGSTICVSDGSGSMRSRVGNTGVSCLDVANAISIYFSQRCSGEFKDRYITFSSSPQFVDLSRGRTLRDKIEIARRYDEVSNTNIEAVFDLILSTAVNSRMDQKDLPETVLVLSDMEFDAAAGSNNRLPGGGSSMVREDERLFAILEKRYRQAGYQLPRLVFWNICSRTMTIPVTQNSLGVALVSGFSVNIMKMVLSNETDPYKCLLKELNRHRYRAVEEALSNHV